MSTETVETPELDVAPEALAPKEVVETVAAEAQAEVAEEVAEETEELSADSESEETQEEVKPKKKGGYQKKLERASLALSEREQRIQELEAKLAEQTAKAVSLPKEPNIADFESQSEYTKAVAKWTLATERAEAKAQEEKLEQQKEARNLQSAYNTKLQEFVKTAPDFEDAMDEIEHVKINDALGKAIITSDMAPAVMYELAKNPKELERINALPPLAAAREIGKLELKLSTPKTETKTTTKAPAPIKTVNAKSGGIIPKRDIFDPNIPFSEYDRLRTAEEQKARKRA
jgi:hypothetical protein